MTDAPPGRKERIVDVEGVRVRLLEAADVDSLLDDAIDSGGPAPYGVVLWPSAVAVARRLVTGGDLAGRRVVDVGAGTGLCSLVAAKLGAEVLAVDVDEKPLALLAEAAKAEGLTLKTSTFNLLDNAPLPEGEVVVFADLLYEQVLAKGCARRALEAHRRGSRVLVGDPERAFRDTFAFVLARDGVPARFDTLYVQLPGDARSQRVGVLDLWPAPSALTSSVGPR